MCNCLCNIGDILGVVQTNPSLSPLDLVEVSVVSVMVFKEQKPFPDHNREKSLLIRWMRSFTIFLALVQHCLLKIDCSSGSLMWMMCSSDHTTIWREGLSCSVLFPSLSGYSQSKVVKTLAGLHLHQGDRTVTSLA